MKLAFSTLGCPEWTFDRVLDEARALGYQGVELRGVEGRMRADEMAPFRPERRRETMEKVRAHGLTLCGFGSSASFHDPARREDSLSDARAAIELCADVGIPYVRVFGNLVDAGSTPAEEVRRVAAGIRELCGEAAGTGVTILLEVHGTFNTAARVLKTVELVNRDNFGILWDVAHSDEADLGAFLSFYEPVRPFIRHVHLKDHRREAGGTLRLCSFGEGDIPLEAMIRRMEADGYEGYCSLEWEKAWHPELRPAEEEFPACARWMRERFS